MGNFLCRRAKHQRIILQGLDAAGKTTVLYKLKLGEVVTTIPTIGFNVETVSINNVEIDCWDIGGRDKIRPLLRHYYSNMTGAVCVVDSNDRERLDEAIDEFIKHCLQVDDTWGSVVMVLANKQDLENAVPVEEIEKKFTSKYPYSNDKKHYVFFKSCSATTGDGLLEAFEEFATLLKAKEKNPDIEISNIGEKTVDEPEEGYVKMFMKRPMTFVKSLLMY